MVSTGTGSGVDTVGFTRSPKRFTEDSFLGVEEGLG